MLAHSKVAFYLMQLDLVSPESIVERDLIITDVSRHNRNFKVIRERASSYLLKQGVGPDGAETVAHEAVIYQLLRATDQAGRFERYLPRFFSYDATERILILEFLREANNLREYHDKRGVFPSRVGAALGNALATLHQLDWNTDSVVRATPHLKIQPPWVLSVHRPSLAVLPHLSYASIEAIKIIQRFQEFCDLLDHLRADWTCATPIHFDIKWDNCLIVPAPAGARNIDLRIVDWELAGLGDPCWDIGSVFHDYLRYWLASIPITGEAPPERAIELARHPLEKMSRAIQSFWQSYVQRMRLDPLTSTEWLVKSARYAAARLIQSVYESLVESVKLTGEAIYCLQLSLNILRQPQEAIVRLLGIRFSNRKAA